MYFFLWIILTISPVVDFPYLRSEQPTRIGNPCRINPKTIKRNPDPPLCADRE